MKTYYQITYLIPSETKVRFTQEVTNGSAKRTVKYLTERGFEIIEIQRCETQDINNFLD